MRDGRSGGLRPRVPLCALADLAPGETRLVATADPGTPDIILVRHGAGAVAYLNDCPHWNAPLDVVPGRFLDRDRAHILCANHGARFDIATGACIMGPCRGQSLTRVPLTVAEDTVWLAAERVRNWRLDPAPGDGRGADKPG